MPITLRSVTSLLCEICAICGLSLEKNPQISQIGAQPAAFRPVSKGPVGDGEGVALGYGRARHWRS